MRVRDYMTEGVFTIRADKKLAIAGEIMDWARVRHVPVVDEQNRLVGLVTHRDLLRASLYALDRERNRVEQQEHLTKIEICDAMSRDVAVIDPEASIQAAARLLRRGKFGCLPVVDHTDHLLGILTEHDLLGILERLDPGVTGPAAADPQALTPTAD